MEGIVKMQAITVVPHAPAFMEGVTNLRGAVLPVIDLRKRFGLPPAQSTKDSRMVVVVMGGLKMRIAVDGADRRQRLIILLDLSKVLPVQEQAQLPALAA